MSGLRAVQSEPAEERPGPRNAAVGNGLMGNLQRAFGGDAAADRAERAARRHEREGAVGHWVRVALQFIRLANALVVLGVMVCVLVIAVHLMQEVAG